MAFSKITLPTTYFGSPIAGRPINGCQVFVGEPDTDPTVEANRKLIILILEDGTTVDIQPNQQPLLCGPGGYIDYNGSTVEAQVDGQYSISVLDNLGAEQYYFPSVFDGVSDQNGSFQGAQFYNNNSASAANTYVVESPNTPRQSAWIPGQIIEFNPSDDSNAKSSLSVLGNTSILDPKDCKLSDGTTDVPDDFFKVTTPPTTYRFRYDEVNDVVSFLKIIIPGEVSGEDIKNNSITIDKLNSSALYEAGQSSGMMISNDISDTANNILFSPGTFRDDLDQDGISFDTPLIKSINQDWQEGDLQGGFPSSLNLTPDTGYLTFAIAYLDDTTDPENPVWVTDSGFDDNASASNLLADATNYTHYFCNGFVVVNGSSEIYQFKQTQLMPNGRFEWLEADFEFDVNPGSGQVTQSISKCPPVFKSILGFTISAQNDTDGETFIRFADPDAIAAGASPKSKLVSEGVGGISLRSFTTFEISTNNSQQIVYSLSDGAIDDFTGYVDYVIFNKV